MGTSTETTTEEALKSALVHHQAGRLPQAEAIYRLVLSREPDQPDALHWLGLVARQSGRNDIALGLLGRAAHLAPAVPAYQHNYAEMWLAVGEPTQAVLAFQKALQLPGAAPESHVGLGIALQRLDQHGRAIEAFGRAIALGIDRAPVHQHLAESLLAMGRNREGEQAARQALQRDANSPEAWHTLGESLGKQDRADDAIASFRKAIELKPQFARPYHGLGVVLWMQGKTDEALEQFRTAIRLKPDYAQAHLSLGVALQRARGFHEAVPCFRRAIELKPNHLEARTLLVDCLENAGLRDEAVGELEQLARLQPGNRDVEFALAALGRRDAPAQPPASSIAKLFDRYAEVFDLHLGEKLHYRAPRVLFDAVTSAGLAARPAVMDLGCGTGLCGQLFRPTAGLLWGVDLSSAMIDKARARGIYDHLEVGDLTAALLANPGRFDVIVAADVFVYLGDLSQTFAAAASALRAGGLFAFTVEALDTGAYALRPTRRYAHSEQYLRETAARGGLDTLAITRAALRTENEQDVFGLVAVLRKPAATAP